jgi:hypothetical protein
MEVGPFKQCAYTSFEPTIGEAHRDQYGSQVHLRERSIDADTMGEAATPNKGLKKWSRLKDKLRARRSSGQ